MEGIELLDKSYQGFAEGNQAMLETLEKALTAGSGVDAASYTGGRAMVPESLDTTLVNVLWQQDEARLFKALKKNPVKSTVHQWTKRTGVGDSDGAWVSEGGDSAEKDQTLSRAYVTMKYLQTLRKITLQMQISNSLEDAEASEKMAGTLWIIKQVEKALFNGDSSIVAEEPDGLIKLIPSSNIIDLRGEDATSTEYENAIGESCRMIRGNFGQCTDLYTSLMVMEDTQKLLRDRIRFGGGEIKDGSAVFERYPTPFGKPTLMDDVFIEEGTNPVASSIVASRPSQPSIAVARSAATPLVSKFAAGDAGAYWYQIVHVNKFGQSQASAAVQVTGVLEGDKVSITVTDGGTPGTGVYVYRSKKDAADGSDCRFMTKLAYTGAGQVVVDLNENLPGCSDVFALNLNPAYDAVEWEQFLPMMKFPLYPTNAAVIPFLMLLFGALGLKKGEQMVRIKNVSYSGTGWF